MRNPQRAAANPPPETTTDSAVYRRRLAENSDFLWIALVVALNAGTVGFMLSHARLSFERYRITGEIEDLTAQERRLELEIDRLRVERAFRADNVDLAVEAAELGLQPVQPGQVWVVNQGAAQ